MAVSLWDEVQGADFGDKRLDRRLGVIVEELGAQPNQSIPAATDSRAEMEAAYRFFDNGKVNPEKILQPHIDATRERISQEHIKHIRTGIIPTRVKKVSGPNGTVGL